jgi:protein-cysteine N-palmitoyltransferase HHAT
LLLSLQQNISLLFFFIGSLSCIIIYNIQFLIALLLQTLISFIVTSITRRKFFIWLLASVWLVILNLLKTESTFKMTSEVLAVDEAKIHDFLVIFAWCLLKNLSFNLERIEKEKNDEKFNLLNCFGYVFYLPTFLCGPHVIFSRYSDMLDNYENFQPTKIRFKRFLLNLLRFSFWFVLTEFSLHFFYIHSIVFNLDLKLLNSMTFFGVGYLMGQFFNNKYIIHYGFPIAFGEFDGISMPRTPRCICRVHKYSDMWKWFDHGLYEFLFKYIYTNLCTKLSLVARKIFAGFITFLFIYIWHGFFDYILIWSIMNCACIVIEKFAYYWMESEKFHRKAIEIVKTENNFHRLCAVIGTHVLIPAIISNFFFFGGTEVGWEFVRRTYLDGFGNYLKISTCIYFLYPVAEAIKRFENQK